MASEVARRLAAVALTLLAAGCVTVENHNGLTPPSAVFACLSGTVGCPRGPVCVKPEKTYSTDLGIHLKEWVFTGLSAGMLDLAISNAKRDGGFEEVYYADWHLTSYLGFFSGISLTVYGR